MRTYLLEEKGGNKSRPFRTSFIIQTAFILSFSLYRLTKSLVQLITSQANLQTP